MQCRIKGADQDQRFSKAPAFELGAHTAMTDSVFQREDYWTQSEPLLELESSSTGVGMPAVTTITFFAGASIEAATRSVRERLNLIVKANPFVAGRVVRKHGEKLLQLLMPASGTSVPDDVMAELLRVDPPGGRVC